MTSEIAKCPVKCDDGFKTCGTVFDRNTFYRVKNEPHSKYYPCINHLERYMISGSMVQEKGKINAKREWDKAFISRQKELEELLTTVDFVDLEVRKNEQPMEFLRDLHCKGTEKHGLENFCDFSFGAYVLQLSRDGPNIPISVYVFEIRNKDGTLFDFTEKKGADMFAVTRQMIDQYKPGGFVDLFGPESQITMISQCSMDELRKSISSIREIFNRWFVPQGYRLLSAGKQYDYTERPYNIVRTLHNAIHLSKNVEQTQERAAGTR